MSDQQRIEKFLAKQLAQFPARERQLKKAMAYSVLGGGKRLRACLVYEIGRALGQKDDVLDYPAASVELLHAHTLILDDLPMFDNDTVRRGKPTNHIVFGVDMAILASVALSAIGHEIICRTPNIKASFIVQMLNYLTLGLSDLVAGQAHDMKVHLEEHSDAYLKKIIDLKTGRLIEISTMLGAFAAQCDDPKILGALKQYSLYLGRAFQIDNDLLEILNMTEQIGTSASDHHNKKQTLPLRWGAERSIKYRDTCLKKANGVLQKVGLASEYLSTFTNSFYYKIIK